MKRPYLKSIAVLADEQLRRIRFFRDLAPSRAGGLVGLALAQGAAPGLVVHQFLSDWVHGHPPARFATFAVAAVSAHRMSYLYVWLGTSFWFTVFGAVSGHLLAQLKARSHQLEHMIQLQLQFDETKQRFLREALDHLRTPLALAVEAIQETQPQTQHGTSRAALAELQRLDERIQRFVKDASSPSVIAGDPVDFRDLVAQSIGDVGADSVDFRRTDAAMPVRVDRDLVVKMLRQLMRWSKSAATRGHLSVSLAATDAQAARSTLDEVVPSLSDALAASASAFVKFEIVAEVPAYLARRPDETPENILRDIARGHGGCLVWDYRVPGRLRIGLLLPLVAQLREAA